MSRFDSSIPIQVSPFEPIKFYEKPQILVSMLLEKELSVRGVRELLFSPESLSLKQRDTYISRLKQASGGGAFSNAMIDLATNPFVWFMFLTTPIGASALARTGRGLFSSAKKYSPFVMKNAPWLQTIGVTTPMQTLNATAVTPTLMAIAKGIERLDSQMANRVVPQLRRVLERNKLNTLDHDLVTEVAAKKRANIINKAVGAKLAGMDRPWVERRAVWKGAELEGMEVSTITHAQKVDRKVLDDVLEKAGATRLVQVYREALDERWVNLFGDEAAFLATGVFTVDAKKVTDLWRGLRNRVTSGGASLNEGTGQEVLSKLFGKDFGIMLAEGKVSEEQLRKLVSDIASTKPEHYLPRNLIDIAGRAVPDAAVLRQQRSATRMIATGAAVPRRMKADITSPDDLQEVFDLFGGTPALQREIQAFREVITKADEGFKATNVFRFNAHRSLVRHFKDTGESHALYVQKAADFGTIRVARDEFNKVMSPEAKQIIDQSRKSLKDRGLFGEERLADVLFEQHTGIRSDYTRRALTDTILPRLLDRHSIHHVSTYQALLAGKQGVRAFLETSAGKALKESGAWGRGAFSRFEILADPNIPLNAGRTASAQLAKYLYVTHLGINLGSTALNLSQPFLLAATWLGVRNVVAGYKEGFRELGGYIRERGRLGFKPMTDLDHTALINKHFKFANFEGENLLGIGRGVFESLDQPGFRQSGALARVGRTESVLFDYPMKPFEKAEWLNRTVTAHAVEAAYKRAGRNITRGTDDFFRMQNDVGRMVGETQFGGTVLNTPLLFLNNRVGDNPLMRQFLSFPLRSLTGVIFQGPRLAGRENFWRGMGFDIMRGLGISAVAYELGKNFLGQDLSRGLFAQASLDLFGGERFLEDGNEWIPVPPVIDIPIDMIKGLASNDIELTRQSLSRLVPGGVALSRAIGMAPRLPSPVGELSRLAQKTYVGYDMRTEEGLVPVFAGDGRLIDFRSGPDVMLRALGADLGRFKNAGELDQFLVKQRAEIIDFRRRALQAYLSNEVVKGNRIRGQFQKKFGFPLTITKEQLRQAIRLRQQPRVERLLDRLPREARPAFQRLVAQTRPQATGLGTREVSARLLEVTETARQRDQLRQRNIALEPETIQRLRELLAQQEKEKDAGRAFASFGAFQQR